MIALSLLVAALAQPVPRTLFGTWRLIPTESRFGPFPPISCKSLSLAAGPDRIDMAFDERLADGRRFKAAIPVWPDSSAHDLPEPTRLSPSDDWSAPATRLEAAWTAGALDIDERVPRRADARRHTRFFVGPDGRLVETVEVRDVVGERHARLVYEAESEIHCP